ncbi:DgyrCDS10270 [Dimorphilus gyrociliatus]|uniref:DgyrCDS10270 n=1 Tax=Dimorphilus gyrociliatus TaxID=2664684 RepID=A0A7I8W1Q0_9ANNE|nr:DgyrCDS10270 [Dimorphilus gyrociliatus]
MFFTIVIGSILFVITLRNIEWFIRSFYIGDFKDKYVLITGCDTGFGNLLAKRLDGKGMRVIAACLTEKGANDLADSCSQKLTTYVMNVANEDEIDSLKEMVAKKVGNKGLHALVNNAGIGRMGSGSLETYKMKCLLEMLKINTIAPAGLCFKFLDLLNMGNGRIINMASMAGRIQVANLLYGITKNGIEGLSSILGFLLKKYGWNVSVHTIEPGRYLTPLHNENVIRQEITESYERASNWTKNKYSTKENYVAEFLKPYDDFWVSASNKIYEVVDAYEHAILSIWPKNRYAVGFTARYLMIPLCYIPTTISDYIYLALE